MKEKHVLFISTSYAEYDRRLQRIMNTLISNDYKVSWISRVKNPKFSFRSVTHFYIDTFSKNGPLFYLEYNIRAWIKSRSIPSDIVTAVDLDTIITSFYASKSRENKFVFDAHEYFSEVPELIGKSWKKKIWEFLANKYIPKVDLAYTVGSELADLFSNLYKVPFSIVRNVPSILDTEVTKEMSYNKDIIYLGVLNKGRGLEQMVEALELLPEQYRLTLLGDGDIMDELQTLVKDKNLQNRVNFKGWVDPFQIRQILQSAWCGINLLDNNSLSYYYSLANKYFDYLHAGLPIIANKFPEYISLNALMETSILIEKLDSQHIKNAILSLEDEHAYNRLKENTKEARSLWNWEREAEKLLDLYTSL